MGLDAAEGERFAAVLVRHEDQIVKRWTELVAETLRGRLSQAELGRQVTEIHRSLVAAAGPSGMSVDGEAAGELRAVLSELSVARARQGFTATETAVSIFALKDTLRDILDIRDSPELLSDYVEFSRLIDELGLFTFETYTKARESVVADQAEQLLELSTPVVKLWEGVVAVPLVGTLDSARAQVVMEKLLQTLVDTGSPYAIIDITGVPAVDTQVAQHVLKTVVAARLMGADCIISGIRPQIAQTIVALGIEFGDIATKASLADALRHAIRMTEARPGRGVA
ncbi:STAS domain-containing protein [Phytohabitans houttuyneae]|uniref:STAS domain-containing protein n=1 Tax=Phytohabitans houttuyneae TaxID=1076126 RepID=UPI0031EC6245